MNRYRYEDEYSDPAVPGSLNLAHVHGGLALLFLSYRELDAVAFGQAAESLRDDRTVMNNTSSPESLEMKP